MVRNAVITTTYFETEPGSPTPYLHLHSVRPSAGVGIFHLFTLLDWIIECMIVYDFLQLLVLTSIYSEAIMLETNSVPYTFHGDTSGNIRLLCTNCCGIVELLAITLHDGIKSFTDGLDMGTRDFGHSQFEGFQ